MPQHEELWNQTEWRIMKNKVNKTGGKQTFKENPVIMEMGVNGSNFLCYTRQTDRESSPTNVVDPIPKKVEPSFTNNLQPNADFETVTEF